MGTVGTGIGEAALGAGLALVLALSAAEGQEFKRLFDARTQSGWHTLGGGTWSVADSALVGLSARGAEGALVSDSAYRDFTLRLKFKWTNGNSGVNFRNLERGGVARGLQVDIEVQDHSRSTRIRMRPGRNALIAGRAEGRREGTLPILRVDGTWVGFGPTRPGGLDLALY